MALLLSGCASTQAQNADCARQSVTGIRTMRWGYYPGFGCGPVPPAQTVYP